MLPQAALHIWEDQVPRIGVRRRAPGPQRPRCAASGYKKGRGFRETPEDAAPHLFTFLRYPGMPPHNNAAELEIRDAVVLHRSVRHQMSGPGGRHVFSAPASVARACQKMGMFPRMAVERMVEDPDWRIFKPPDCPGRVERPVRAAAAAPSVAIAAAC